MKQNENLYRSYMIQRDADTNVAIPAYTPMQIRRGYNVPCKYQGYGNTIAIVVAYGNPNMVNDLAIFNRRFSLPDADIELVYPQGEPTFVDPDWQIETSLDVEWSHVLAPKARILVVASLDNSFDSLNTALKYAIQSGANIISMSWGSEEMIEQLEFDKIFKDQDIVFLAASGDSESVSYPAISPYVIGVGGTSLQLSTCGKRRVPETAWPDSGGGISAYEQKPAYQYIRNNAQPRTDMRTSPDISFFADPFPGVPVYTTLVGSMDGLWITVGGTSLSSPCQAGIFASALPPGTRVKNAPKMVYQIGGGCYYTNKNDAYIDIKNGNTMTYPALKGYDYVTGLGSPNVLKFICAVRKYLSEK